MLLPAIGDVHEAVEASDVMLRDERLTALLEWFRPSGRLVDVVAHVRQRTDSLERDDSEHVSRILEQWAALEDVDVEQPLEAARAAARAWDFRIGRERDAIPRDDDLLPAEVRDLTLELARDWGMASAAIPRGRYDAVIPIGGLVRANIGRPLSVARWASDGLDPVQVIGLASARTTSPREREQAQAHGVPAETEQASLRFGLEQAFDLDPESWVERVPGVLYTSDASDCPFPVSLVVAPEEAGRRANTAEGLRRVLRSPGLEVGNTVLQVTTSIYWIANQISARTTLDPSVRVETAGYDMQIPGWDPLGFTAQHYLQEVKAALDALPVLLQWADTTRGTR
jgi:hypothetical protein